MLVALGTVGVPRLGNIHHPAICKRNSLSIDINFGAQFFQTRPIYVQKVGYNINEVKIYLYMN
jgi:hypothetical protein